MRNVVVGLVEVGYRPGRLNPNWICLLLSKSNQLGPLVLILLVKEGC